MFQLARWLRDIQTSINSKDFGLLVNIHETENICKDKILSSFLCVLALSSVICLTINLFYTSCGFQKYKKMFNQNIFFREKSDSIFFLFCFCCSGHDSLRREIILHSLRFYWDAWCLLKINLFHDLKPQLRNRV